MSILKDTCIIPYQRSSNRISFVRLSWCSLVNIITQNNYHNIHLTKFYDNHEHIKSIYEVTFKLSYIQFNYIQLNSFNEHMYKQYLLPLLHRIHKSLIFWWGGVINKHEYTDWTLKIVCISFEHVVYSHFFPIYMDNLGRLQFHLRKINYRPRDCYKYCILVYTSNIVMHEECMFLSSPLSWKKLHWVNRFNQ